MSQILHEMYLSQNVYVLYLEFKCNCIIYFYLPNMAKIPSMQLLFGEKHFETGTAKLLAAVTLTADEVS